MIKYKVAQVNFSQISVLEEELNHFAKDNWDCVQVLLVHQRASNRNVILILKRNED